MIRKLMIGLAATSMAFTAAPIMAQDEEEARTTYRIEYIDLADGAGDRWTELGEKYFGPATDEAGLKRPTIHWLMTGRWDVMMIFEMPGGMAMLDTHNPPERRAFRDAFIKIAGSEEEARKIWEEDAKLVKDSMTTYSHTHP